MVHLCANRILYINENFYRSADDLDLFDEKKCLDTSCEVSLSKGSLCGVSLVTIHDEKYIVKYGRSSFQSTGRVDDWLLYHVALSKSLKFYKPKHFKNLCNLYKRYPFGSMERDVIMSLYVSSLKIPHTPCVDFVFADDDWNLNTCTKYREGKDMFNVFTNSEDRGIKIPFRTKMCWATSICQTVQKLHKHNIAHMDIALENIVVEEKTNRIVLIDYGFSIFVDPNEPFIFLNEDVGRQQYKLWEMMQMSAIHPMRVDVYALGVLLFHIFFQIPPYSFKWGINMHQEKCLEPNDLFYEIIENDKQSLRSRMKTYAAYKSICDYPEEFFDRFVDLLCDHMMQPQTHISSLDDVLSHEFFREYNDSTSLNLSKSS